MTFVISKNYEIATSRLQKIYKLLFIQKTKPPFKGKLKEIQSRKRNKTTPKSLKQMNIRMT